MINTSVSAHSSHLTSSTQQQLLLDMDTSKHTDNPTMAAMVATGTTTPTPDETAPPQKVLTEQDVVSRFNSQSAHCNDQPN